MNFVMSHLRRPECHAGFVFAGMAVVSFLVILPASRVSDRLGRKWTIVPSAVAMASALLLMAAAGACRALLRTSTMRANGHIAVVFAQLLPYLS